MAIDLLVFQATSRCNLNCSYCYLPEAARAQQRRMPLDMLERAAALILRSNLLSAAPTILWHAGEPLTAGLDFYRQAFAILTRNNVYARELRHSFQTNGTLINRYWCDLFRQHRVDVGVSLDGPGFLHDLNRRDWHGRGSFAQAMRGIECLQRHGLAYAGICVLTAKSLEYPDQIFEFFRTHGFKTVGFNLEEIEAAHSRSGLLESGRRELTAGMQTRYSAFMARLVQLWKDSGGALAIREFDNLSSKIALRATIPSFVASPDVTQGMRILTVRADGKIVTFSPELASGTSADPDRFVVGDIGNLEEIEDIITDRRYVALRREISAGLARCRRECGYFDVCGGGCPSNKYYENGTFDCSETRNCLLHTKTLIDVLFENFVHQPEFAAALQTYIADKEHSLQPR